MTWNNQQGPAVCCSQFPEGHMLEIYHPTGTPNSLWHDYYVKITRIYQHEREESLHLYKLKASGAAWLPEFANALDHMIFTVEKNNPKNRLISTGSLRPVNNGYYITSWIIDRVEEVNVDGNTVTVFEDTIEWDNRETGEKVKTSWRWVPID